LSSDEDREAELSVFVGKSKRGGRLDLGDIPAAVGANETWRVSVMITPVLGAVYSVAFA